MRAGSDKRGAIEFFGITRGQRYGGDCWKIILDFRFWILDRDSDYAAQCTELISPDFRLHGWAFCDSGFGFWIWILDCETRLNSSEPTTQSKIQNPKSKIQNPKSLCRPGITGRTTTDRTL